MPESQILGGVVDRAQHAEALGYHRFWVAEHHAVPGIAGSAPTVLMAALAARTSTIRVGSGGIMVPDHQPLIVAEQLATLEALYPGRIDAGLGSSVGFTAPVRRALRQADNAGGPGKRERYAADLRELSAYLAGSKRDDAQVTARPADSGRTPLFLLTGGRGLSLAAKLGTGAVVAVSSLEPEQVDQTAWDIAAYRDAFAAGREEDSQSAPARTEAAPGDARAHGAASGTVILAVNVAVAATRQEAHDLLVPEAVALVESRRTGEFSPLRGDIGPVRDRDERRVVKRLSGSVYGDPDQVATDLAALVQQTGADEVLATGGMADPAAQLKSDELLMRAW